MSCGRSEIVLVASSGYKCQFVFRSGEREGNSVSTGSRRRRDTQTKKEKKARRTRHMANIEMRQEAPQKALFIVVRTVRNRLADALAPLAALRLRSPPSSSSSPSLLWLLLHWVQAPSTHALSMRLIQFKLNELAAAAATVASVSILFFCCSGGPGRRRTYLMMVVQMARWDDY